MKTVDENFLNMSRTVKATLEKFKTVGQPNKRFEKEVTVFNDTLGLIEKKKPETIDTVSGASKEKAESYTQAVNAAVRIAKVSSISAMDKGDMIHHDALRISKGSMANYSSEKTLGILSNVYEYTSINTENMEEYRHPPPYSYAEISEIKYSTLPFLKDKKGST